MTASWSVGEARALAIKAARGVGMTWGEAEEAGFALGWLTRHNAPGITAICRYLSFYDQSVKSGDAPLRWPDKSAQGWFCPIGIGAALSDGAIPTPQALARVREPLLLLPFLAKLAHDDQAVMLELSAEQTAGNSVQITVSKDGFSSNVEATAMLISQANCQISRTDLPVQTTHSQSDKLVRVQSTASACISALGGFAHNTYAPATKESRLAGAGAGLNDND